MNYTMYARTPYRMWRRVIGNHVVGDRFRSVARVRQQLTTASRLVRFALRRNRKQVMDSCNFARSILIHPFISSLLDGKIFFARDTTDRSHSLLMKRKIIIYRFFKYNSITCSNTNELIIFPAKSSPINNVIKKV